MMHRVDPDLACVLCTDQHGLVSAGPVCEYNGKAVSAVLLVALHGPADHIGIVEIVMLRAVHIGSAQVHHQVDPLVERGAFHGFYAVIVAVEYAGVSLRPQQDHGIRQRYKPGLNGTFQGLPGLCVVIIHESYRVHGIALDERIL